MSKPKEKNFPSPVRITAFTARSRSRDSKVSCSSSTIGSFNALTFPRLRLTVAIEASLRSWRNFMMNRLPFSSVWVDFLECPNQSWRPRSAAS